MKHRLIVGATLGVVAALALTAPAAAATKTVSAKKSGKTVATATFNSDGDKTKVCSKTGHKATATVYEMTGNNSGRVKYKVTAPAHKCKTGGSGLTGGNEYKLSVSTSGAANFGYVYA